MIGFFGLLTILFIALKLTGIVAWSWLAVASPAIVYAIIQVAIICFMVYLKNKRDEMLNNSFKIVSAFRNRRN